MYRTLIALSLAATVVSAQEPTAAPLYFPTKVGDKQVYEVMLAGKKIVSACLVTKADAKDTGFLVTTERESAAGTIIGVVEVSGNGVFAVPAAGHDLTTPVPALKLPAKEGESWTVMLNGLPGTGMRKAKRTVGKEAEVVVPAGKFKAIPVVEEVELIPGQPQTNTSWHAQGVGVVKSVSLIGKTEIVTLLKSFTPGK